MSYIDHSCTLCGHLRLAHVRTWCSHGWCRRHCSTQKATYGPSRLIATFARWGVPNEAITEPGTWVLYPPGTAHTLYACRCDDCQALYQELNRKAIA